MLYNGSDVIRDVEWVIFDEVHYVNDAEVRWVFFSVYMAPKRIIKRFFVSMRVLNIIVI